MYVVLLNLYQGCKARKVISEVYTSLVLQCTVSGRWCKHKTDVEVWHGIHHSHKKSMKYSGHRKLLCELSKLSKSSDTKRTLMHLLLFTNSAQRELVSICTQSIHNRNWLSLPYIHGKNRFSCILYNLNQNLYHL